MLRRMEDDERSSEGPGRQRPRARRGSRRPGRADPRRPVRALLCPASLKASSRRVTRLRRSRMARGGGHGAVELPIADGGEGTTDAFHAALGGVWKHAVVSDPLGRPHPAPWLVLPDGRAVVEGGICDRAAVAHRRGRDPLVASSRGLGELVLAALRESPDELLLGLGGSATVDGGAGLREVLRELPVSTTVLCDVRTTLAGAARLFGPQKGATPETLPVLERRLVRWASSSRTRVFRAPGRRRVGCCVRRARRRARGRRPEDSRPGRLRRASAPGRSRRDRRGSGRRTTVEEGAGYRRGAVRRRGVRCVVFGGRFVEPLAGVETISLSGDPAHAEADLELLGSAGGPNETRRRRGGLPWTRASSRRPADAPRRTAGRRSGEPVAFTSVAAVTVAVRGLRSMSAISPNDAPGPIVATDSPCTSTDSSPSSTTKNMRPPSPSRATLSPAGTFAR